MRIFTALLTFALITLPAMPAYAKKHRTHKKQASTLYQKLGGKKAIEAVVDDFVGRCASDDRIKGFFAKTAADADRLQAFKKNLVDQICQATGGPCKYRGKDMRAAHRGMRVQPHHFDALVEDLSASLDSFQVKPADKKKLLAVLGKMKGQIVERGRHTASKQYR